MSETTNLKLKKHDNVETNTDKFDIENYLNGNWDKIDKNVGEVNTNISNINSKNEEQDTSIEQLQENTETSNNKIVKLETELKEMQEDFYQNSIRGQASGEYIHVEDSSNCRSVIGISGNSEQETSTQTENYVDDREARGKTISQATSLYLPIVNLKAGENYYFKIFDKDNQIAQDSRYLAVEFYDANKTKIQDGPLGFPKSFTEEVITKIKYAKIYYNENDTDKVIGNTVIKKIGLKITSNASADDIDLFVPNMPSPDYPSEIKAVGSNGSVKVTKCNKNLSKYKTFTSTSSARIVGDTTTSGQQIEGIKVRKGKKYTISFDVVSLPSSDYRIQIRESTDESVAQTNGEIPNSIQNEPLTCKALTRYSKTITAQGDNYLYIRCIPIGFVLDNIQVEENIEQTSYEEHQEQSYIMPMQQPFRAIGDVRDTFIKKDVNWYERHNITRKIFNGTEEWKLYDSNASTYRRFGLAITEDTPKTIKILSDGNKFGKGICSHFKVDTDYRTTDLIEFIQIGSPSWYIGITDFNSKWADVEALKTYLSNQYNAGTPLYVDYVLETPIDIECTEEQNEILEDLNNTRTYKNVTNITTDSKAILSLDYAKDLETLLTSKESEV